jgi:hypothetical protein
MLAIAQASVEANDDYTNEQVTTCRVPQRECTVQRLEQGEKVTVHAAALTRSRRC